MNISRLLGATMVAGADSSGGGRPGQNTAPAAHVRRVKQLRRGRAWQGPRAAAQHERTIAKVAR